MNLELPGDVRDAVRDLVAQGEFPTEEAAVVELVRVGLSYRYRTPTTRTPPMQRDAPREPGLPDDVNWMPPR